MTEQDPESNRRNWRLIGPSTLGVIAILFVTQKLTGFAAGEGAAIFLATIDLWPR